jgi:hypothetical protein
MAFVQGLKGKRKSPVGDLRFDLWVMVRGKAPVHRQASSGPSRADAGAKEPPQRPIQGRRGGGADLHLLCLFHHVVQAASLQRRAALAG